LATKRSRGNAGSAGAERARHRATRKGPKLKDLEGKNGRKIRGGGVTIAPIVVTKPVDKSSTNLF
jgi:type VI protein secretion system component Hcp